MIYLCSKYVKNCNIFGQILNIWAKLILKKNFNFFFQCLALPKDPQSFGPQNLRCPFLVSQYYRRRRLCLVRFFKNESLVEMPHEVFPNLLLQVLIVLICSNWHFNCSNVLYLWKSTSQKSILFQNCSDLFLFKQNFLGISKSLQIVRLQSRIFKSFFLSLNCWDLIPNKTNFLKK